MWGCPMKKFSVLFALSVFCLGLVVGCDDSSSASGDNNETSAVESSSSISTDKEKSSDSKTKQSSSSIEEQNSSSTEKMSSSSQKTGMNDKSSSSVNGGASSSSFVTNCKVVCSEECEGTIKWRDITTQVVCRKGAWLNIDSLEALSSSSYFDMTNQFNTDIKYGTHTDSRDGKTYKTITMKYGYYGVDSLTFFAENLNFGKMVQSSEQQGDSTKYCYDNDPWYCEHGFGGLYSWNTVMKFPAACNNASIGSDDCPSNYDYPKGSLSKHDVFHKGICDEGWHVMHEGEWAFLWERAGISSVASAHGSYVFVLKPTYFGLNKSGLSILPAGRFVPSEGGFSDLGEGARFWRSEQDEENSQKASFIYVPGLGDDFSLQRVAVKENAYSIRCVKDYKPEN